MAYFPFFMEVKGVDFLIVGGGLVAYRKVEMLLKFEAHIRVVSPTQVKEIKDLAHMRRITLFERNFKVSDLEGAKAVIVATSDEGLNRCISEKCRSKGILVNVVDEKEQCGFIFPAILKDGDVVIGISTGGASPAMARMLKGYICKAIPEGVGAAADLLKNNRTNVKEQIACQNIRETVFTELAETAIQNGGDMSQKQVSDIIIRGLEQVHG